MKITMVKEYLEHYMNHTLNTLESLTDKTVIDYSTAGVHVGKEKIAAALLTDMSSTYRYSVISNVIEYPLQGKDIVIANVFHYYVRVIKNQYSPLIIGGKYKFVIDGDTFEHILFDLEAEMGNTYLAKHCFHWKLFEETKTEKRVFLDTAITENRDDREAVADCLKKFFFIADSGQLDQTGQYVTDHSVCELATSTYSEQFKEDGRHRSGISAEEFIRTNKQAEDQNHHSFRICELSVEGSFAFAVIEMLEPTRLGFKHFDALTVFKPYYNEQWHIELVLDGTWKIKKLANRPISKFQTVGYDTLELS